MGLDKEFKKAVKKVEKTVKKAGSQLEDAVKKKAAQNLMISFVKISLEVGEQQSPRLTHLGLLLALEAHSLEVL